MNALTEPLRTARWLLDRWLFQRRLRDLPDWDAAHHTPGSGVWWLAPPCGYDTWKLYGPGAAPLGPDGFNATAIPTAEFDATAGPGFEDRDDLYGCQRFPQIQRWARPWIEQVAGGRVVEMVEGWTAYGPDLELREYAVFARVETGRP